MKKSSDFTVKAFDALDEHYTQFLEATKDRILSTRLKAAKVICQEQIQLYWWIGEHINKAQEKYSWGKSVVEQLSSDIRKLFNGTTMGVFPKKSLGYATFLLGI